MQALDESRIEALGRLAAGVVHELNGPLGAMRCASDTLSRMLARLEDGAEDAGPISRLRDPLAVIDLGAERIGELVRLLGELERLIDLRQAAGIQVGFAERDGRIRMRLEAPAPHAA